MSATITATPIFQNYSAPRAASAARTETPAQVATDSVETNRDIDEKNFSWLDLGRGIVGSVGAAAVTTVGMTASSLVRAPQALAESYKTLIHTNAIGPVLKCTIGALLPAAAVAAPIITAIGSCGYGLFKGFVEGAEKGLGNAVSEAAKDVKYFHNELSGKLIDGIREASTYSLPEGEKPYDIEILGGAKGLVGATAGAAVDGVGIGAVTLVNTPRAFVKINKAIWQSEAALPLKVGGTLLSIPAAPLAVAFGTVGGAIYGLGIGAKDGYTEGVGTAVSNSVKTVGDYARFVDKGLDNLD